MIGPVKMNNVLFVPNTTYCCEYCQNVYDFLEMTKCFNCKGNYCLQCKNSSTHKCINDDIVTAPKEPKKKKCNFKGCKVELDLVNNMVCNKCNFKYCMNHRLYESHQCKNYNNNPSEFNKMKDTIQKQNNLLKLLKKEFLK